MPSSCIRKNDDTVPGSARSLLGASGFGLGFLLLVFIGFLGFFFEVFTHSCGS